MFVADIMTPNPVTITPETTIADAAAMMQKNKFRRLPVVQDGQVVGIVTDRDLMEVSPSSATTLSIFELNYLLSKMEVKEIMSVDIVTIEADAVFEEAALAMYKRKIGGLPVVDDTGRIVGILTETDVFKALVDVMGLPDGATRITLITSNRIGVLKDVSTVFTELGLRIGSVVAYVKNEQEFCIVIRAVVGDAAVLTERLTAAGYPPKHIARIGQKRPR